MNARASRAAWVLALVVGCVAQARAQIIRPVPRVTPSAWASLGIGWLDQQGFCDRDTGDCWGFGSGPQWRASLEFPLGNSGTTVGAVGTTSRLPLIYRGTGLSSNSCFECDADANVSQVMALLRMGGGRGFHQVIDIAAGETLISNFRSTSGTRLGSGKMTRRFTFDLAYGFGYGISPRTQFFLVQEYGLIILPRQQGNANNVAQQRTTRIGGRVGLGGR